LTKKARAADHWRGRKGEEVKSKKRGGDIRKVNEWGNKGLAKQGKYAALQLSRRVKETGRGKKLSKHVK